MLYKGNQKLIGQTYTLQEIKKAIYPVGSVIISYIARDFTIEMPDTTWELEEEGRLIEATRDTTKVNTLVEAGLPDITGSMPMYVKTGTGASSTSALYQGEASNNNPTAGSSAGFNNLFFKASRNNSIYGASNTVQPKTRKYYVYRRIA